MNRQNDQLFQETEQIPSEHSGPTPPARPLIECQEALKRAEERCAYLSADFDNYRRRSERERIRAVNDACKDIMLDIISLVDNFERAYTTIDLEDQKTRTGLDLIYKAALKILEEQNVTVITETEQFDPEIHEAMMHVDDTTKAPGTIVAVLEKGYRFKHELLRPARVSVVR